MPVNGPRWYCIQTRPNQEQIAVEHLNNQDFENHYPTIVMVSPKGNRNTRPLFPNYLFVHLDLQEERWKRVNGTRGVKRLLPTAESPIPLPEGFIEALMSRKIEALRPYLPEIGKSCRVLNGALVDREGICVLSEPERVELLMWILGREQRVPFRPEDVRVVT